MSTFEQAMQAVPTGPSGATSIHPFLDQLLAAIVGTCRLNDDLAFDAEERTALETARAQLIGRVALLRIAIDEGSPRATALADTLRRDCASLCRQIRAKT